jgi:hypothetical protein
VGFEFVRPFKFKSKHYSLKPHGPKPMCAAQHNPTRARSSPASFLLSPRNARGPHGPAPPWPCLLSFSPARHGPRSPASPAHAPLHLPTRAADERDPPVSFPLPPAVARDRPPTRSARHPAPVAEPPELHRLKYASPLSGAPTYFKRCNPLVSRVSA